MEFRKLAWDSEFFETPVYALEVTKRTDLENAYNQHVSGNKSSLVYVYIKDDNAFLHETLVNLGSVFCDTRIVYKKKLSPTYICLPEFDVEEYHGGTSDELERLAVQAGLYSRFHNDVRLRPYYEGFFKTWLWNSLNGQLADKVFVMSAGGEVKGFITYRIKNGEGWIGLVSVDITEQQKGVGKSLIWAVERSLDERDIGVCFVVTQEDNFKACKFYESCGYEISQREFIYHLWI